MYKPQKILVTGAAGFIGANYVHYMLKHYDDIEIISLDKLTYAGSLKNLESIANPENHKFIKGDINNQSLVELIIREYQIDTVVHFAAESHVDNSIDGPQVFIETNINGTFALLDACKRVWLDERNCGVLDCRFHHVSTDEVYGSLSLEDKPFTESSPYVPNSPYSASKASSDHLVRSYFQTYDLPISISNCSNNYGRFQHTEKLLPKVMKSCLTGSSIPIYGNGKNIRDWLHVEDHCLAIDKIIHQAPVGEQFNIGGEAEWDNLSLVQYICEMFDKYRPTANSYGNLIEFVKDRPGHDMRYAIDISKIKSQLQWQPTINLMTGLEKLVKEYIEKQV